MSRNSRVLLVLVALLAALLPLGLGSTAYAESCGTLHATDVRADSPQIDGELVPGVSSTCYTLDLPAGTVVAATINGSLTVRASGDEPSSCLLDGQAPGPCRLAGQGPFKLTVAQPGDGFRTTSIEFHLHVLALTADDGCATLTAGAPGSQEGLVSDDLIGTADLACRALHLTAGPIALSSVKGDAVTWTLVAPDGTHICQSPDEITACAVPSASDYTVLFSGGDHESSSSVVTGQIANLADSSVCTSVTPSWRTALSTAPTRPDGQLSCRTISGLTAGESVALGASPASRLLVDADGNQACDSTDLGCIATGTPPFRYLSASPDTTADSYPILLRKVGPTSDCPMVSPVAFSTQTHDSYPGVGCRAFHIPAGHRFTVLPHGGLYDGIYYGAKVYDDSGQLVCAAGMGPAQVVTCRSETSSDFTLITDLSGADSETYVYDLTSTDGCTSPPFSRRSHDTDLVPSERACENLDDSPGTVVTTFIRSGSYYLGVTGQYVDATGADACAPPHGEAASCTLVGKAPFRVLLNSYTPRAQTATLTAQDLAGCGKTIDEGPTSATDVDLSTTNALRCLRVPTSRMGRMELIHLYRTANTTGVRYPDMSVSMVTDDGVVCPTHSTDSPQLDLSCWTPGGPYTLVVLGAPGTVRVARSTITDLSTIVNWRAPAVGGISGVARPGSIARARLGQWSTVRGALTTRFTYRWIVARHYVPGATQSTYTIPKSAAGHSLAVEVTAHNSSVKKIVRSASIIVGTL